jgi:2-oxo-4-hydroxy-4-carboxy-5-ureidoimidazoline decarboxylase
VSVTAEATLPSASALERLNGLPEAEARLALTRCCAAARWVDGMLEARPFASASALHAEADAIWSALEPSDFLEAFSHHPEIGADLNELRRRFAGTADLSQNEQAGAAGASDETLLALRELNRAYRERFGYGFIVCATGKSAQEMLAILRHRLENSPDSELPLAAAQQAQITHLRLEKICS